MAFLQYVTGSPNVKGNQVHVTFDRHSTAITANTCSRSLSLPAIIEPNKEIFRQSMLSVVADHEKGFTMP